jgi:hypothetical protein
MTEVDYRAIPPQALAELNRQGEACLAGAVRKRLLLIIAQ